MACSNDLKGMKTLPMNYNGMFFEIMVDEGTYKELIADKVLQNQYAKTVYESNFLPKKTPAPEQASQSSIQYDDPAVPGQSQLSMLNNVGRGFTEETEECVSASTPRFQPETLLSLNNRSKEPKNKLKRLPSYQTSPFDFDSQAPSPSLLNSAETLFDEATNFKWDVNSTKLLLDVRLNMEREFCMPNCRKKKLWVKVADNLNEMLGSNYVSADTCDLKYRNLLGTYRVNKKKQNTTGEGAIKWEFFEIMDRVLGHKASSAPPKQILGSTLDAGESSNASICQTSDDETAVESDASPASLRKRRKMKKNEVSLNEYLFLKLEKENEKQMDQNERSEKKWTEKKELKLREIDAINNLAAAISGSYKNQKE